MKMKVMYWHKDFTFSIRYFYGNIHDGNKLDIIVTPIQALLQSVPSPKSITKNILSLQRNHEYPREELVSWLQEHHYQLTYQVENSGEYALRGGIVDIFPYASDDPLSYRVFWGRN